MILNTCRFRCDVTQEKLYQCLGGIDAIVDVCCLQHTENIPKTLRLCYDSLGKGGKLFNIMVDNSTTGKSREYYNAFPYTYFTIHPRYEFEGIYFRRQKYRYVEERHCDDYGDVKAYWIVESEK